MPLLELQKAFENNSLFAWHKRNNKDQLRHLQVFCFQTGELHVILLR